MVGSSNGCRLFIFPRQFATTLSSKMTIHVQATIHTLDDSKIITPPIAPLNEDINQWKQHGETFYMNFRTTVFVILWWYVETARISCANQRVAVPGSPKDASYGGRATDQVIHCCFFLLWCLS
ncbi:uncharacterized protein LOC112521594 [Cynara cardunculus var. scolymus]|uniref:uncharacterized protein LOC112521594 n=1 Tax=Cynara cardunculus var. scolymus TaxID=59895 RepID=UPI000D62F1B8|nr:uncharacterized protein LOC112521594 [Cynara cardunculus var. scolymus]XP_024986308.1 uncharacterized protein LOC112521594 [Cynara cardunculus var. scolymus]